MGHPAIDIAAAVAQELATAVLLPAVTIERLYRPQFELKDLTDPRVLVVPKSVRTEILSRVENRTTVEVDVAVQGRVNPDSLDDLDAMMSLVDQISAFLNRRRLAAAPSARWSATAHPAIYVPDHLIEQRVFTSVMTLTYQT